MIQPLYTGKIDRQLQRIGWTKGLVEQLVNSPHTTCKAINKATDSKCSAFFDEKNNYVVIEDDAFQVVQVSDRNDETWILDSAIDLDDCN